MSSEMYSLASRVKLANGATMPRIHFGLYMIPASKTRQAVRWALEAGYRGFDSAQMYGNERETGAAIREALRSSTSEDDGGRLAREDVFYTTKLASCSADYQQVRASIRKSVDACGLGYVDLFLLHSPYGGREARLTSWRALEDAVEAGEVRMAGVSNYGVRHIEELMASHPKVHPVVNQIEVHPFNTNTEIREVCAKYNIVVEAYAPLARGMRMKDRTVLSLADKYHCTPAQLLIRWSLQHGMVPLPKSAKRDRIISNAQIGGFEISQEDMKALDDLDEHLVTDWDPTDAA
ncbi:hypothetical protein VTK73DRAFT_379 [Phialemonium thermophilum]|uniref:NADP-dependent oxidoreductase domain-containing protein n=1 Tax=Phialemonium thermophilum TaxID=223376 RepID=A0ABR3VVJ8_9PEZI